LSVFHAGCRGLGARKCRRRTCTDDRGWRSCRLQIMKKWKRAGDIGAYAEDVPVLIMSSMTQTNDMMPASHASHGWGSRPMNSRQQQSLKRAQESTAQCSEERYGKAGRVRHMSTFGGLARRLQRGVTGVRAPYGFYKEPRPARYLHQCNHSVYVVP
jgi:hypothetical protein